MFTQGIWEVGYGKVGVTGPTVPVCSGATCGESVDQETYYRMIEKDPTVKKEYVCKRKSTIVTVQNLWDNGGCSSVIAIVPQQGETIEERDANARLISCAPEMYLTLKLAQEELGYVLADNHTVKSLVPLKTRINRTLEKIEGEAIC